MAAWLPSGTRGTRQTVPECALAPRSPDRRAGLSGLESLTTGHHERCAAIGTDCVVVVAGQQASIGMFMPVTLHAGDPARVAEPIYSPVDSRTAAGVALVGQLCHQHFGRKRSG